MKIVHPSGITFAEALFIVHLAQVSVESPDLSQETEEVGNQVGKQYGFLQKYLNKCNWGRFFSRGCWFRRNEF